MSEGDNRDQKGRFQRGNRCSPGRPRKQIEEEYRTITLTKVPKTRWAKIVIRAVEDAINGDAKARSWLTKVLGLEPPQRIAETDSEGNDMTLAKFLSLAESRPDDEQPSNIIDTDAEYEIIVAEAEARAAAAKAAEAQDTEAGDEQQAESAADLPPNAATIDVAHDGAATYSTADDAGE